MKPIQRALTTLAASVLLTVGAAAMAAPAQADVHLNLLNAAQVAANGVLHVDVAGMQLIDTPNPLAPAL
ncbi:hypothetical protein [Streptomyces sp. ISL-11]|uniref:hypothetical protein n=1 Tax=Streptomyces sp. ISL-11 TaxID=2819174 RepID=UPI001BEB7A11|nr:hypothetical protein [Streptomyces sp. ISL-11]MBT2387476.1 hypothetical protein [Streptomyces sp. ISL-11]